MSEVEGLLKEGVSANDKDASGETPLMWACGAGHVNIVVVLLTKGGAVNEKDKKGQTALMRAAENNRAAVIALLLATSTRRRVRSRTVRAAGASTWLDGAEVFKSLPHAGLDVLAGDETGQDALIKAAGKGQYAAVELLCHHANIARHRTYGNDGKGRTALMYAAEGGHTACVRELVKPVVELFDTKKAVAKKDKEGKTALDLATAKGHKEVVELLQKAEMEARD